MAETEVVPRRILVIDDEEHIVKLLMISLRTRGYAGISCYTGEEGLLIARRELPDCILLDVMLPGINGVEVCRRLKADSATRKIPVLMLSAKSEGTDKINGLEGGADDYITKPFSVEELFLRVKAALRQVDLLSQEANDEYGAGDLILDTQRAQIRIGESKIDFTLTEYRMLQLLIRNKNREVLRDSFYREIFDRESSNSVRTVDVHIRNIRRKIAETGEAGCRIETVHGTGYKLVELK